MVSQAIQGLTAAPLITLCVILDSICLVFLSG